MLPMNKATSTTEPNLMDNPEHSPLKEFISSMSVLPRADVAKIMWTVDKIAGTVADITPTRQMLDLSADYETFRTIEEIGPTSARWLS